jgi:DNA-binding winged helix-turn-helix (wHTH) protein/Tol biopolymer transport system component
MAAKSLSNADFWVGDWLVRPGLARIERAAEVVHITPRSMAVLVYLAEARGRVISRNEILDAVWPRMEVTQDALSQCIVELRKAFRDDSKHAAVIETIPRVGIRLIVPVSLAETQSIAAHLPLNGRAANEVRLEPAVAETATSPSRQILPRAVRPASSGVAPVLAILAVALGSAAFWFAEQSTRPWPDPLVDADFFQVTDFIGAEEHAIISRDGRFVAFISDRDGVWDVWVGQIGTGDFRNLTNGRLPELRNPAVRMLNFSHAGTDVLIWTKTTDAAGTIVDHGWTIPIVGGDLRSDSQGIAELDWSPDGEQVVYHPSAPGDPLFIAAADERGAGRRIHVAAPGAHCHFPLWSHDAESIYFVQGFPPDEMDLWRLRVSGGEPERLTWHNSRVSFPTLLGKRMLLYLATAADGSGPWLHVMDLQRRESRRVKTASNPYTSIAASLDGRRIVATEAHPAASLWRVSLGDAPATAADASQIPIQVQRGVSPRIGPHFIVYRAPKAGTDGLWRLEGGAVAKELWSGVDGRVVAGPALNADGTRLAFTVQKRGVTRLYIMNADGSGVRGLAQELDVRGAPAWSPTGDWVAIAAIRDAEPRLFKIPVTQSGPPIPLGHEYGLDPVWSPSGEFLVFTGRDVGTTFEIKAVNADGTAHVLPPLFLNRGSRRLDFLGVDENALVVLKGTVSHKEFWVIDLRSADGRPLTDLGPGPVIGDFDVSLDASTVVFDRVREESEVVRIDLAEVAAD